ncbi:hypothetical protein [Candidatus Magnetaquicoccus inordinatus]|uniref:hypothetical protein n=1 Tax=Candidatus Magnetaquicoccus inordinatus TaxID=2496818 RepID=UPI00102AC02E|nr:hypothetical protein [Candidatus Magnetaquicoccus inordinatus]
MKKYLLVLNFMTLISATMASDMTSSDDVCLLSCARPLAGKAYFEHCYVMLTKGDQVLDSRGYFGDVGSIREPAPGLFQGKCEEVKRRVTMREWQKVTETFDKQKASDYSATSHNCCSVTLEAILEALGEKGIPDNAISANSGIGTRKKC